MVTITEDYVSFETAKLLEEKGFNFDTEHEIWYVIKPFSSGTPWNSCIYEIGDVTREYDVSHCIAMPTLQMVMKWLREVYNIDICAFPYQADYILYSYNVKIYKDKEIYLTITDSKTYEEACEAAIKYCLENLI